jgi:hypothetical protein
MACDALALSAYPDDRCAYAESLLRLSTIPNGAAPVLSLSVSAAARSSFEKRMALVVSEGVHGKRSAGGILLAGLVAVAMTPSWSIGKSNDGMQAPIGDLVESDDRGAADIAAVNVSSAMQTELMEARKTMRKNARERVREADERLTRAQTVQLLATKRLDAMTNDKEDGSQKLTLAKASDILDMANSELEYAQASRDLAEKQLEVTK